MSLLVDVTSTLFRHIPGDESHLPLGDILQTGRLDLATNSFIVCSRVFWHSRFWALAGEVLSSCLDIPQKWFRQREGVFLLSAGQCSLRSVDPSGSHHNVQYPILAMGAADACGVSNVERQISTRWQ